MTQEDLYNLGHTDPHLTPVQDTILLNPFPAGCTLWLIVEAESLNHVC